ncbi:MAG TPA: aminotransferase class III-fold pyridoxal phosphate-dependent enzyme [Kofleriaceae bacterium]|nr:aminotransferase class III-fold pyridoxal phosphate-dependent enzyme [Kofleriaceae bacterium]
MNAYERTLQSLAASDPDLVVMTAENRAAIRSLPAALGSRFIDVGIAEQTMIGMAAGLALRGRKPIVHALAAFLTMRAYEFIRTDIGIARLPVKLVGGVPGFLSEANGPTHQAIEDIAIMRGIPGMKVFCPADEADLAAALPTLLADPAPCYIRYPATGAGFDHPHAGQPHRIETLADGDDVAILTFGMLVGEALEARALLAAAGVTARVLSVRMPKPLDEAAVLAAAVDTRLVVTLEDHLQTGGLYSIVCELLVRAGLRRDVMPIALAERWFKAALLPELLVREGFSGAQIAARILKRIDCPQGANRVGPNSKDPVIARSKSLWERARQLIPGGTQTLAKGPGQHIQGVAPMYLTRGRGARVWDVDGNEYLDMTMAVGPLSLGYADPVIDEAIRTQLGDGITFSLMHPLEVEVAELIRATVPNVESVRFSKTGADVTSAAIRVARAFTDRERVVCCGYHGWHDWYIATTDRGTGIPHTTRDLVSTFDYNDLDTVRDAIDVDTACVILEPMVVEMPQPGFLEGVRALCDEHGALLVFDEMWTGFRLALGGAQERFGVRADLACYSKAIANGMPLSVLAGRADAMQLLERDVFFYTTFGGEALSLAAAAATIPELRRRNVPETLAARGRVLREGYAQICAERDIRWSRCLGMDARTLVVFDPGAVDPLLARSYVQQELIRRGVLWSGFHNLSWAHRDSDIGYLLGCYREIVPALADHVAAGTLAGALRGRPVEPVFRRLGNPPRRPRSAT